MHLFSLPYCKECGESRVPHLMTKLTHLFDDGSPRMGTVSRFISLMSLQLERIFGFLFTDDRIVSLVEAGSRLGVGTLRSSVSQRDNTRTQALFEGADARGVKLTVYSILGTQIFCIAEKMVQGKNERVLFTIIPRPNGFVSPSLPWMDNKGILKTKLQEAGLPCAEGGIACTIEDAKEIMRKVGRPVITKPFSGSRGRHTTLDIRDEKELERAFAIAQQLVRAVVVESYLHGTIHRVTLVDGEPVAIARREYPHVTGDGVHTVQELIDIENQAPYRNGNHFRKLDTQHRGLAALEKQGLDFTSVPVNGRMVILNDKNSRLHGTLTEDVTDTVHPDNIELFRRLAAMLGDPIVGVDFMITDMQKSWKEQPDAGVIECNSMPFIDVHHRVVSGRQINVAAYLWDMIFKERSA